MCSAHRPDNGADSDPAEPVHWQDRTCDYCGRTVYRGKLHPQTIGRSTAMVCEDCYQRDQERYAAETGQA
jgi:ribosome-binding protein aMBF1 (putative translation factor)